MGTEIKLQQGLVVLLANNHNPSILNPDFLKYNDIIPKGLSEEDALILSTSVASVLEYSRIKLEGNIDKVSFSVDLEQEKGLCPDVVKRYVDCLKHVTYTAVGTNFIGTFLLTPQDAGKEIFRKFICDSQVKEFNNTSPSAEIKLSYKVEGGKEMTFSILEEDNKFKLQVNNHRTVTEQKDSYRIVAGFMEEWEKDLDDFYTFSSIIQDELS